VRGPRPIPQKRALPALYLILLAAVSFTADASEQPLSQTSKQWFAQVPFEQWAKEGPNQQIPCKGRTDFLGMAIQQRLVAGFEVRIDGGDILSRGKEGKLVALIQVSDKSGNDYRDVGELSLETLKEGARGTEVRMSWLAFVRPGEYSVTLVLYHSKTKEHSLIRRSLRVPDGKKSFQSALWNDLPNVEFLGRAQAPDPDAYYLPSIEHDVHVAFHSTRPISLEIIADVTPSDAFAGSTELFNRYLDRMLPTLRVLANANVTNGSIRVSAVDLLHRREVFDQRNVRIFNWERFRKVFNAESAGTIDVASLNKKKTPVFLRQELTAHLGEDSSGQRPLRIFVVLTAPLSSYSFSGLEEQGALPEKCDCRVYYLEFDVVRERFIPFGRRRLQVPDITLSARHSVEKLLRPLPVKSFEVGGMKPSESVADALKRISEDLEKE